MPKAPRLRRQLMISYLLLLVVSLTAMTLVFAVFLRSRPAPPEPVYQRLAALLQGFHARGMMLDAPTGQGTLSLTLREGFEQFAVDNAVRVLLVTQRGQTIQRVLYDSEQIYDWRDLSPDIQTETYANVTLERVMSGRGRPLFGRFQEANGDEWLFGGVGRESNAPRQQGITTTFMLAERAPTATLQTTLSQFTAPLIVPIIQAALIGFVVAFLLAWIISRSLVRPLQALANGAQAVARGDYDHQVPEQGAHEMRLVAHAFNEMSANVRANQNAQRDFLANISHDLKTPLTSIQGYAQAIVDGAARDPHQAANIIYDEASRLNRMVMQLTDLLRIQSAGLTLNRTQLDISQIARAITERLAIVANDKHITLTCDAPPIPPIPADGDRIAQVVTNLISNAIKFTHPHGHITIQTRPHKQGVQLIITDDGQGIPTSDLPHIFDRFYQVDKARSPQRGTGLGLAITREIIEAHGGTIDVQSPGAGQGTQVTVWLPSI